MLQEPVVFYKDDLVDELKLKERAHTAASEGEHENSTNHKEKLIIIYDAIKKVIEMHPEECINKKDKLVAKKIAECIKKYEGTLLKSQDASWSIRTLAIHINKWIKFS